MKTASSSRAELSGTGTRQCLSLAPSSVRLACSKIEGRHLERLAVVYVRQSSPQQVLENRESTARQYALVDRAVLFGWPRNRVLVIDEDLGKSGRTTQGRTGFHRLVAEVTMNHVGIVLGLEMSRLARSCRDWHDLFEVCGFCDTLLADEDGVYEPHDPNDRLVLGLKGIMSEMELHVMRNRLERGRLNKAQRGELFYGVPLGYVILPSGEVDFDPDARVQAVVRLLFEKFDELGSLYSLLRYLVRHDIQLPIRPRSGPNRGQIEWRRPTQTTLIDVFHHPIYAGAYAYPRRVIDSKHRFLSAGQRRKKRVPMGEWKILIKGCLPAYITWDRYLQNQQRLRENRSGPGSRGTPRKGSALLPGLLVCGTCGRRMHVSYTRKSKGYYSCVRHQKEGSKQKCYGLRADVIDELVSRQILCALEPAALELSLKARADLQQERERLTRHWHQRLEAARYDVQLAERRYRAVDPENRLVASTLERRWEEALRKECHIRNEYDRFLLESPQELTVEEQARVTALASDIPALWISPTTTHADRQAIVQCLVDRVVVHVERNSEYVDAAIHWAGGYVSQHEIIRPVRTYEQLRDFDQWMDRIVELRAAGHTAATIANTLRAEGFTPPQRCGPLLTEAVRGLMHRRGLCDERQDKHILRPGEWWLKDLATGLEVSAAKLREWAKRGWIHSRKSPIQGLWIVWANESELTRLRQLRDHSERGVTGYPNDLTTPLNQPRKKG